ncbi:MAG: DUF928 domain-containing protein [Cyanobacteria bacterium P01_A01_bin.135]
MKPKIISPFTLVNLTLLPLLNLPQPSQAQAERPTQPQPQPSESGTVIYNPPDPPPGQGAPVGRRSGGASRGLCQNYGDLAALVPVTEGKVWGQTTAAQPTLWFYLPAAVTAATPLELVVQDAEDNFLYSTSLMVEAAAGSLAVTLPDTVDLPVNEPHVWTLSLFCDPDRPAAAVFVQGIIERVPTETATAEAELSLSQARTYANQGIWHDALTIVGRRLQHDGMDVDSRRAWTTLLDQVGLTEAASAPVLTCCEAALAE